MIHGQITTLEKKLASNQKPYFNLELSDGAGVMKVKVWNNSPAFPQCTTAETKMKPNDRVPPSRCSLRWTGCSRMASTVSSRTIFASAR